MRQRSPRRTTWTPWRRSQPASSKPFDGPCGRTSSPSTSRRAPCGGARPSGSSRSTGSSTASRPKRATRAGRRSSNRPRRGGPVTVTAVVSDRPTRARRTLRSSSASRLLPHQRAASAAAATTRKAARSGRTKAETATATAAPTASAGHVQRATRDAARPTAAAAATGCGTTTRIGGGASFTAAPGRGAGRGALGEPVETGAPYRSDDVDDDARRRCRRRRERRRWERRRGRRRAPTVGEETAAEQQHREEGRSREERAATADRQLGHVVESADRKRTRSCRKCADFATPTEPGRRAVTGALPDDEVHELPRHGDRLTDLLAVEVRAHPRRLLRPRDELVLGRVGRHLDPVTNATVHLDDELEGRALEPRRVGDGPRLLPEP